jgi:hypothetical protein
MIVSNTLNVKEILKIYLIEQKIQITKMSDMSITVIYHATCMSLTLLIDISITKRCDSSDTSITVLYHAMSLTALYCIIIFM